MAAGIAREDGSDFLPHVLVERGHHSHQNAEAADAEDAFCDTIASENSHAAWMSSKPYSTHHGLGGGPALAAFPEDSAVRDSRGACARAFVSSQIESTSAEIDLARRSVWSVVVHVPV